MQFFYSLKLTRHAGGVCFRLNPRPGFKASKKLACSEPGTAKALVTRAGCSPGTPEPLLDSLPHHLEAAFQLRDVSHLVLSCLVASLCFSVLPSAFLSFSSRSVGSLLEAHSWSHQKGISTALLYAGPLATLFPHGPAQCFPKVVLMSHTFPNLKVIQAIVM